MQRVSDNVLYGHYGNFRKRPERLYHAVAVARILQFRGAATPKHLQSLLERVKDWNDEGYGRRKQLLGYFGIKTYEQYLCSELWRAVRALALKDCERCRFCTDMATQVHHRSYDIATVERLYPTCRHCHYKIEFDEYDRKRTFEQARAETIKRELIPDDELSREFRAIIS